MAPLAFLQPSSFTAFPTSVLKHQFTSSRSVCPTRQRCLRNNISDLRNLTKAAQPSQNESTANLSVDRSTQHENARDGRDNIDDFDEDATFIVNVDGDDNEDQLMVGSIQPDERIKNNGTEMGFDANGADPSLNNGDEEDDDFLLDGVTVVDVTAPQRRKKQRRRMTDLLNEIAEQEDSDTKLAGDAGNIPELEADESFQHVRTAVKAADQRKGENIVALRVSRLTHVTSFIVIVSGNNPPQLRAISNLVEDDLNKIYSLKPKRIEGIPSSGWILLDYGDILVNVFSHEQRDSYDLEKLWKRGEVLDISDCLIGPEALPKVVIEENTLDDWLGDQ